MTNQLCRKMQHHPVSAKRTLLWRMGIFRRYFRIVWNQTIACWMGNSVRYKQLMRRNTTIAASSNFSPSPPPPPPPPPPSSISPEASRSLTKSASESARTGFSSSKNAPVVVSNDPPPSDLVHLKISVLGDCRIGKTSFLAKYVGRESDEEGGGVYPTTGLNQMDKILSVGDVRISYSVWEVGDDSKHDLIPVACMDCVAILLMFDLTSRCTLNNAIGWYHQASKWNKTAILVLVGTKYDDFVQLPIDMQWTIASEARQMAKSMNATLFFSSAIYNINVNKIFKFITAKLFNLPWHLERNLRIGEPIIDF